MVQNHTMMIVESLKAFHFLSGMVQITCIGGGTI